jgi:hypothetical protein
LKRLFISTLGVALIVLLAPVSGAWAGQTITVPNGQTVMHFVCGNGDTADFGNSPCDSALTVGNTVTIDSGGAVQSAVFGVSGAYNDTDANGVTGNQVTVNGKVDDGVVEGGDHDRDGTADDVTASGNTVTVGSGAVVTGGITGGYAVTYSGNATASDNTVQINGGTISRNIIGGSAERYSSTGTAIATATGNTVTIQGSPTFVGVIRLWGGDGGTPGTNNTLNLHVAGLSVVNLRYFQKLNFELPASLGKGGTMITATNMADITDVTGADISIAVSPGSLLKVGDEIVLIDVGQPAELRVNGALTVGTAITSLTPGYTFDVVSVAGQLVVKLTGAPSRASTSTSVPALNEMMLILLALLLAGTAMVKRNRSVKK